jgi:hypothetical protein
MESLTAAEGHAFNTASQKLDVETYRVAVALNNRGVVLLQSGEYDNAARLFKEAYRRMMSAIQETSPPESSCEESLTSPLPENSNNVTPDKWLSDKSSVKSCNLSALETTSFKAAANTMSFVPTTATFVSGDLQVFGRPLMMHLLAFDNMDPLQFTSHFFSVENWNKVTHGTTRHYKEKYSRIPKTISNLRKVHGIRGILNFN